MKALTYNLHKGVSLIGRSILAEVTSALMQTGADIVFLQEIVGLDSGASHVEAIAEALNLDFVYGQNAHSGRGHYGNAILSRWPILQHENIDISNSRLEQRGLLHAVVEIETKKTHLICVHLDLFENGRKKQYSRLIERINQHAPDNEPLIIGGDFNDWRGRACRKLEQSLAVSEAFKSLNGALAASFPSALPLLPLDRLYSRGFTIEHCEILTQSPWNRLSDHCALIATLLHK
jgi:endonuclease/exonuclease/phosphatase family metal-dependent hydrolase